MPSTPTMAKIESPKTISINVLRGWREAHLAAPDRTRRASRGVRTKRLDDGESQHRGEGSKLEHQDLPIDGHNQGAERTDQDAGVDEPRQNQHRDRDNAKR